MRSPSSTFARRVVAGGVGLVMTAAMTFAGAVTAQASDTSCDSGVCTVTFGYTGSPESWTVPEGVTSVTATVAAGSGGHAKFGDFPLGAGEGGLGGVVKATLPVIAGEDLVATVGGAGKPGVADYQASAARGGYGGGGSAGTKNYYGSYGSGAGGGGSFLAGAGSLLLAAGGGGGTGVALVESGGNTIAYAVPGGHGGSAGAGSSGSDSNTTYASGLSGKGATASGPGAGGYNSVAYVGSSGSTAAASGGSSFGVGGAGANNPSGQGQSLTGAGGGGGYYGGGGGGTDPYSSIAGAGGGGSGFVAESATNVSAPYSNAGNGKIVITYTDPKVATTTDLKVSDNPNDAIPTELTATVSPAAATGTVTFKDGSTELGSATLTSGTATLSKVLSAGTHTITASYTGDSSYGPSTADTTVTVATSTTPSFSIDSSSNAPVTKRVVAGEAFSFSDLKAIGTPAPTYSIENDDTDSTVLPDGVTFTNGILAGSSTRAGTWKIKVTATNSVGTATEYVKLTIAPGTATALEALVSPGDSSSTTRWAVAPDGTVATTITANQGDSIVFDTMPVDQYGNPTTRGNVQPVTTSSVDTDTITYDPTTNLTTVTFNHASPHTITFKVGNLTNSFTVQVTPTASAGTGNSNSTAGAASTSSHLATTGSAPFAPLGLALGILAAGIAVTLVRRYRTTRRSS